MDRRDVLKSSVSGIGAYNTFLSDAQAQGTSHAPKLKITAIRTAGFNKVSHRFVRIYTDQGVTGTGNRPGVFCAQAGGRRLQPAGH